MPTYSSLASSLLLLAMTLPAGAALAAAAPRTAEEQAVLEVVDAMLAAVSACDEAGTLRHLRSTGENGDVAN